MSVGDAASQAGTTAVRLRVGWIVGPWTDLLWFIGGALGGYGLFFLHAGLQLDMLKVWLVWYVLLDAPHFFGTYARTYLDRERFRRRRLLLLGSLGWLAFGPLLLGASFVLYASGFPAAQRYYQLPLFVLVAFVGLWAYWHVVRQHYGILSLYKRKNHDFEPADQVVDRSLLYVGLLAPFAAFVLRHPDSRSQLGLPAESPSFEGPWGWEQGVIACTALAVGVAAAAFVLRQLQRWQMGAPVNVPKALFLLAVVPLHVLVCYHPAVLTASLLSFSAFVTIFHDLQYHAIVWHYQRTRCHRPGVDPRQFGVAGILSRHFALYMLCAVVMGVVAWRIGCSLGVEPGCIPVLPVGEMRLFGDVSLQTLVFTVALGFLMHHYFVDQFIWRPSKDAELRKDLNIARR